jgi:hypothetical protein
LNVAELQHFERRNQEQSGFTDVFRRRTRRFLVALLSPWYDVSRPPIRFLRMLAHCFHFRDRRGALTRSQRILVLALLLTYTPTATGVPIPRWTSWAVSEEAFPCAAHGCGCDSAEHCWRTCCCHTLAQRLDWARANNVRPPEFAIAAARLAGLDWDSLSAQSNSASSPVRKSCCVEKASPTDGSTVLGSIKSIDIRVAPESAAEASEPATNVVIAWRAMECQGQSGNWLTAAPAVVIAPANDTSELCVSDWLCPLALKFAPALSFDLATPPPELG